MKNFGDYLQDQFFKEEPQTLDDQFPDAFNDWIEQLDGQEYIDYADKFFKEELKRTLDELIGEEETPANKGFFMWCQGYNQKRKEIIDIKNKLI